MDEIESCTNGCGRDGIEGRLVPDSIFGLDISPVCRLHDLAYADAENLADEQLADAQLARNLVSIIQQKTKSKFIKWLRLWVAYKYITAVVLTDVVSNPVPN